MIVTVIIHVSLLTGTIQNVKNWLFVVKVCMDVLI
jgi:hypothetical protein